MFLPPQTKIIHIAILGAFTIGIMIIFKTYSTLAALAPSRGPNLANYEHTISATRRLMQHILGDCWILQSNTIV